MIPLSNSDKHLRCIVNMNGYTADHDPMKRFSAALITDVSVNILDHLGDPRRRYHQVLEMIPPTTIVGTYISGARVQSVIRQYPPEAVSSAGYPEELLLPEAQTLPEWEGSHIRRVNIKHPEASERFLQNIVSAVRHRGRSLVFLDNIVHPSADPKAFAWQDTCWFVRSLRYLLRTHGIRVIANVAVSPWVMSDEDVAMLSSAVDGMAFEMPYHKNVRGDARRTARQIEFYRRWLSTGKTVVMIPIGDDAEAATVAAFARSFRVPGDRLFSPIRFSRQRRSGISHEQENTNDV